MQTFEQDQSPIEFTTLAEIKEADNHNGQMPVRFSFRAAEPELVNVSFAITSFEAMPWTVGRTVLRDIVYPSENAVYPRHNVRGYKVNISDEDYIVLRLLSDDETYSVKLEYELIRDFVNQTYAAVSEHDGQQLTEDRLAVEAADYLARQQPQ